MSPSFFWMPLGIIEDIGFWLGISWWIILFLVAWYYYNWAQEHLAFSPLLTNVVAAILIFYLVIQYPLVGITGWLLSIALFSCLLWILPWLIPFIPGLNQLGKKQ